MSQALGVVDAGRIYASLTWKRQRRGKLLYVTGGLAALPVLGALGLLAAGHFGRATYDELCQVYFGFLIPFIPALLGSQLVAEELENRTFTFLFARPAPRSSLVLGKYFAVVAPTILLLGASLAASWFFCMIRFPSDLGDTLPHFLRTELSMVIGVLGYAGIAVLLGSWSPRHPFIVVLAYLLAVELGLGSVPLVLNRLAMSWHIKNLGDLPLPTTTMLDFAVPMWASAIYILFFACLGVGLAVLSVTGAEYHGRPDN
jgi:ABC-type transport system involved in multi-copper enzyme maturation permease subunit